MSTVRLTEETLVDQEKGGETNNHVNGASNKMAYSLLLMRLIAVYPSNHYIKYLRHHMTTPIIT
jgi:hypothetical protein